MNDHEGEGQEDPEREHEHGARQVDDIVPEMNLTVDICFFTPKKLGFVANPTAKTINV